jgi:hypothetical protein
VPESTFDSLTRHFWLLLIVVVAINLAYGKYRSRALIEAGVTTADEISRFVRCAFALLGGAFFAFWLIQVQDSSTDMFCLMQFPPATVSGAAVWTVQALLSGTVVWWLWLRDGHEILARVAPAFTSGAIGNRQYSPTRVRFVVTALVVGAPLMNIVMQLVQPGHLSLCQAI